MPGGLGQVHDVLIGVIGDAGQARDRRDVGAHARGDEDPWCAQPAATDLDLRRRHELGCALEQREPLGAFGALQSLGPMVADHGLLLGDDPRQIDGRLDRADPEARRRPRSMTRLNNRKPPGLNGLPRHPAVVARIRSVANLFALDTTSRRGRPAMAGWGTPRPRLCAALRPSHGRGPRVGKPLDSLDEAVHAMTWRCRMEPRPFLLDRRRFLQGAAFAGTAAALAACGPTGSGTSAPSASAAPPLSASPAPASPHRIRRPIARRPCSRRTSWNSSSEGRTSGTVAASR